MSAEIAPPKDNIRERILITTLRTKCASDFHFLINVRANADGIVMWYRAWPQSPPQGYQLSGSGFDELDFDAIRSDFRTNAMKKEAEKELLSRVARPGFPGFLADLKTGCKVWDFVPQEGEKVTWSGRCVDGLAEGQGAVVFVGEMGARRPLELSPREERRTVLNRLLSTTEG